MATLEKLENNKVKLSFEISKDKIEEGTKIVYNRKKWKFSIPGFRKGKAPRKIIETYYGKSVFFEDAVNYCLPEAYEEAVKEHELDTVSAPDINITDVSEDKNVKIEAEVYIKPEVTVSNYKGLVYPKYDDNVSEDEIQEEIEKDRKQNSRLITVEDRAIEDKDIVVIDFEGFIDGVPFEGGTGTDYELVIGSKTFIDNFEDQLIGHNIGETVEVNVTFPGEYGKEELQNKPALFKVTVKEIKYEELPEIDDDFAQDVSEFETFEEYKNDIRERLTKGKQAENKKLKENAIVEKLVLNTTLDLPEVMVENQVDQMLDDFERRVRSSGLPMEMYLQYVGQSMEELEKAYQEPARQQVISRLALEKVAELENIVGTEEDIDKELERMAEIYEMEKEKLQDVMRDEDIEVLKKDLAVQKALDLIVDNAVEE